MRTRTTPFLITAALAAGMVMPWLGRAQTSPGHEHDHGAASAAVQTPLTDGEVKKIDPEAGKITLKHGEIRHLDMPPMTMVFTVKDKTVLAGFKVADKVRFMAVNEGGKVLLTAIEPAP